MKIAPIILILALLLIPIAAAVKPSSSSSSVTGYDIEYKGFEYLKQYENKTFHYHVFNKTDGFAKVSGISCTFHLYEEQGDHLNIQTTSVVDDKYDYEFLVNGKNFSRLGEYHVITQCNDSKIGGFVSYGFEVTTNGLEPTSNGLLIFFLSIFLLLMIFLIILMMYSFGHFIKKDFDLMDLAIDYGIYFGLVSFYIIELEYLNHALINSILSVLIYVGAFTNMFLPTMFFIISMIWNNLQKHKQEQSGGVE